MQIQNATLQGLNKSNVPLKHICVGGILKILLVILLVQIPTINIYGLLISNIAFYLLIVIFNFRYIHKGLGVRRAFGNTLPSLVSCAVMSVLLITSRFAFEEFPLLLALGLQIILGVVVYLSTLLVLDKNINLRAFIKKKSKSV